MHLTPHVKDIEHHIHDSLMYAVNCKLVTSIRVFEPIRNFKTEKIFIIKRTDDESQTFETIVSNK